MLTITSINNNNYSIYSRKIKNQESPEIIEAPLVDSVSFQGKNITKADKSIWSFLKLPFAALAEKYNAYKEHREEIKIAEARIKVFLSTESSIYSDINYQENEKLLLDAYLENPQLTAGLMKQSRGKEFFASFVPTYNSKEIAAIVKANKDDPEFAYNLASVLGNSSEISSRDVEIIKLMLKSNPELVRLFKKESSNDTARVLRAYNFAPNYTKQAHEYVASENLLGLIQLRASYPDEVSSLTLRDDVKLIPSTVARLCPYYKKKTAQVENFLKITKGQDPSIFSIYLRYPKSFSKFWSLGLNIKELKSVCKADTISRDYLEIANNAPKDVFSENIVEKANFALAAKNAEPFIDTIKEKNPEIKLDDIKTFKTFVELYKDRNNQANFNRMLDDGRCSSLEDMISMLDIYTKYPNNIITDRQVTLSKDPLAKLFDLK